MKLLNLIILTICSSSVPGQTHSSLKDADSSDLRFSLTLTTFNHAARIFEGTTTYFLTDTSVKIVNTSFGDKKGRALFSKTFPTSQTTLVAINKIRLDTAKEFYFNHCVMITSGNEYALTFKSSSATKHISLHHYYLKQLDDIVYLINSTLPEKYRLRYLKNDTKQDCKL